MRVLPALLLVLLAAGANHAPGEILRYRAEVARTQTVRGATKAAGEAEFVYDLAILERLDGESVSVAVTCRAEEEVAKSLLPLCPAHATLAIPLRATLLPGFGPWESLDLALPADLDPEEPEWGGAGELAEEGLAESWSAHYRLGEGGEVALALKWHQEIQDSLFPRTTDVSASAVYRLVEGRVAEMDLTVVYTLLPFQITERLEVHLVRQGVAG